MTARLSLITPDLRPDFGYGLFNNSISDSCVWRFILTRPCLLLKADLIGCHRAKEKMNFASARIPTLVLNQSVFVELIARE
jgi:hypothetical protein